MISGFLFPEVFRSKNPPICFNFIFFNRWFWFNDALLCWAWVKLYVFSVDGYQFTNPLVVALKIIVAYTQILPAHPTFPLSSSFFLFWKELSLFGSSDVLGLYLNFSFTLIGLAILRAWNTISLHMPPPKPVLLLVLTLWSVISHSLFPMMYTGKRLMNFYSIHLG